MYGSRYGHHNDIHYPNYVRHGSYCPSYGGYGYYYPAYGSTTCIYTPVYIEPTYDVLGDSELDEAVNEILKSLPSIEDSDDSIGAESLNPDDIALQLLLIELDESPEDLLPQPEVDSDESSDAQEGAADPQGVH